MTSNLISEKTSSGIPVYISKGDADLAAYKVIVKAGSRYEPIDGISHVMEHMSFKGTESRSKEELRAIVDGYGGYMNAATGFDWIYYDVQGHSSGAEELFGVITDMVCKPSIKKEELEPEKKVILQEMAMRDNNPVSHFYGNLFSTVWRGSSLEHKVIGDEESVTGTTVDDLRKFHDDMFIGENIAVLATGKVDTDMILDMTEETVGKLGKGKRARATEPVMNKGIYSHESSKDNRTCYASVAFPSVLTREEMESMDILCMALSDGLSSRLYQKLREEKALIYNLLSPYVPFLGCNIFSPGFTATEDNVREGLSAMMEVLSEVRRNGITETELRNAKMKNAVTIQSMSESTKDRIKLMQYDFAAEEDVLTVDQRQRMADSVTLESVLAVAEKVMDPARMHVVVYGTENDGMKDFTLEELSI